MIVTKAVLFLAISINFVSTIIYCSELPIDYVYVREALHEATSHPTAHRLLTPNTSSHQ